MAKRRGFPLRAGFARRLPSFLKAAAKHATNLGVHFALACLTRRFPMFWLRGRARLSGQQATLLVAGKGPWVHYLPGRFFDGEPERELIGHASIWTLPGLLRRLGVSADLTIARIDRISELLFLGRDYLSVPEWIGSVMKVPEDPLAFVRSSDDRKGDMRRARHYQMHPVVSHSETDFDLFYDTMYAPYIRRRHGALAFLANRESWRRRFRRGGILWVEQEGERVVGSLFTVHNQVFYSLALGTADGRPEPRHHGALAATYVYDIHCARQLGCAWIDYGGCRPSLHDGGLRYKRKWGITLKEKRDNYFDLLIRWNRLDGPAAEFLKHTSLIFRDRGGFSAIHVLDADRPAHAADVAKTRQSLWIGGLKRLYLFNPQGWQAAAGFPPDVVLLDPHAPTGPRDVLRVGES